MYMNIIDAQSFKIRSILVLLIAGLSVWFFIMVAGRYALRPKADANSVSVSFNPASVSIPVNESKTVNFSMVTQERAGILGMDLNFAISGPIKISQSQDVISSVESAVFTTLIKTDSRFGYTTVAKGDLPETVSIPIDIRCTGLGQATVSVNVDSTQIIGSMTGASYTLKDPNTLSINCGGVGTFASGAPLSLTMTQKDTNIAVNQPTVVEVVLQAEDGTTNISAFTLEFAVNSAEIDIVDVSPPVVGVGTAGTGTKPNDKVSIFTAPSASCTVDTDCPQLCITCVPKCVNGQCTDSSATQPNPTGAPPGGGGGGGGGAGQAEMEKILHEFDPATGKIKLTYTFSGPDSAIPNSVAFHMILKGKKQGELPINVLKASVTGNIEGDEYTVNAPAGKLLVGTQGTGTGVQVGSPTGAPVEITLNLTLHFQGISVKPSRLTSIPVRIGLDNDAFNKPEFTEGTFVADSEGNWTGTVSLNAPAGDGYRILIKGPYHLQKRICDKDPKDLNPEGAVDEGAYNCARGNISLKEGEQDFDFSEVANLVGDLPDQDGILNSNDIILCRKSIGDTSQEALQNADINMDGGVNVMDCSLILTSATKRHDEK